MSITPLHDYESVAGLRVPMLGITPNVTTDDLLEDLGTRTRRLKRLVGNLDLYSPEPSPMPEASAPASDMAPKVFLVHGHDVDAIRQVELLLRRACEVDVVILSDQASRGQTVIEKLEEHLGDQSSFAVVLMTGDDVGRSAIAKRNAKRARQNVVFELGYALAALGRSRVAALYEEGVEIPSDFAGVTYISFRDDRRWEVELLKELRAAGMVADANKA
ncbi:hypothetical protein DQ354_17915 [Arthrobacter sp. AQ5-06]|nr:hypothetical protein DQ354_17915 [Arthrobacter sp. AQ5-06]